MEVAGLAVRLIPVHTQVFQHHNIMGMLFSFAEKRDMIIFQRKKSDFSEFVKGILVCGLVFNKYAPPSYYSQRCLDAKMLNCCVRKSHEVVLTSLALIF